MITRHLDAALARRRRSRACTTLAIVPLLAGLLPPPVRAAGPVDFGMAELQKVIADRGLNPASFRVSVEYSMALPAEGFQIQGLIVRGGSRRAVMYGLLEAADQLRERKSLSAMKATPKFDIRAARLVADAAMLARPEREWNDLFAKLAWARFNRLRIEMPALSTERAQHLARLAPLAEEHAVDLSLSLDEIDPSLLLKLLGESIVFKAVQVPSNLAPTALATLSEAGRYVTLDVASDALTAELRQSAQELHVPLLGLSPSPNVAAPHIWLASLTAPDSLQALASSEASGFEAGPLPAHWTGLEHQLGSWTVLSFNEERGKAASRESTAPQSKSTKKKPKH